MRVVAEASSRCRAGRWPTWADRTRRRRTSSTAALPSGLAFCSGSVTAVRLPRASYANVVRLPERIGDPRHLAERRLVLEGGDVVLADR